MRLDVNVDCVCEGWTIIDVDVRVFSFLSTTCESGPEVAEKRALCEAASQLWRQDHAKGKRTCVC